MEQWKTTTSGYKGAADLEVDQQNAVANQTLRQAQLDNLAADRTEKNRIAQERVDVTNRNAATGERKAAVSEALLNGGNVIKNNKTGEYFVNKRGGGGLTKLDLKDYTMDEILAMQAKHRVTVLDDQQAFDSYMEGVRQKNALARIDASGAEQRETNAAPGGSHAADETVVTTEQEPLAAEKVKQSLFKAAEWAQRPENKAYASMIEKNPITGMPELNTDSMWEWLPGSETPEAKAKIKQSFDAHIAKLDPTRTTTRTTRKGVGAPATTPPVSNPIDAEIERRRKAAQGK